MEVKTITVEEIERAEQEYKWNSYDVSLSKAHILNYGVVYLDDYNKPMEIEDVDYILEK